MNKYIRCLVLLLTLSPFAYGQITLTNADMPLAGDTIRFSETTNFAGLTPELTDSNYVWDYSTLVATSQTVDTFVSVNSTGLFALYFFGASFAKKSNTPPLSLSGITVDYQYDFFGNNATAYTQWGLGANVSGLPLGLPNTPKDTLYRFPLNYLDTGNTSSTFSASVPGIGYYGGERTRVDTVDGWGTLITPYGTYQVLRVKSVVNETDTVFLTSFGFGLSFPLPERVEYKWLANGKKVPLLQINTSLGIVNQVIYRDSLRSILTGVQSLASDFSLNVYPNPATSRLSVEAMPGLEIKTMYLFNDCGERLDEGMCNSNNRTVQFDVSRLAPGIYFLKAETNRGEINRMFIKQ